MKILVYFDVFHYPLSTGEITHFLGQPANEDLVIGELENLLNKGKVFVHEGFYALEEPIKLVERRKKENQAAQLLLPKAFKIASFLYGFPYVRGVGVSGSLSKNVSNQNADIDFFIITRSNRLWIARTLMHLFKKFTFLAGRQHWFCMNYYIDEDALEINEKNIYTATEVVTVLNVCGDNAFKDFYTANKWCKAFYPNEHKEGSSCIKQTPPPSLLKRFTEAGFNNKMGNALDNYLMALTTKRWNKKERDHHLNMQGNPLSLRTGKHFARPNPDHLQKKILTLYQDRLQDLGIEDD